MRSGNSSTLRKVDTISILPIQPPHIHRKQSEENHASGAGYPN